MCPATCAALAAALLAALTLATLTFAHRSGCHRWHSCPSDTGSYVCGDLGYCSQCSDNEFCVGGLPRLAATGIQPAPAASTPSAEPAAIRIPATVVRVIDGDTVDLKVAGRVERLPVIGLNSPETVDARRPVECLGRDASDKAKALLPVGVRMELERDLSQGDRDRYGRLLRYIWVDGRNFAKVMIEEGCGFEYTYSLPYKYQDAFQAAQRAARAGERGLWARNAYAGEPMAPRAPPPARPPMAAPAPPDDQTGLPPRGDSAAAYPCKPGRLKGNRNSRIYHAPGQQHYGRTYADVQGFDMEANAAAAGFRRAKR